MSRAASRRRGFTLIEVLAVVLLTGIVLAVAIDFYLDLSRASQSAVDRTRNARRAALLLDRVARDLEAAVLVRKPQALDPQRHPWLFLAEADSPSGGAGRLKFVTRGRRPRSVEAAESDLEMVAWMLEPGASNDFELRRWSSPQLPPGLDRAFPSADQSETVAGGIASFGVRLLGDDGQWTGRWDSSTLVASSELPLAAEISVSLFAHADTDTQDGPYVRRVLLPLRPLDLEAQLEAGGAANGVADRDGQSEGEDLDGDGEPDTPAQEAGCVTVAQCLQENPGLQQTLSEAPADIQALVQGSLGQCARDFAAVAPVPASCLQ
jgi:prepilin-type N-terminal cleavage/methylation domain-containing protein